MTVLQLGLEWGVPEVQKLFLSPRDLAAAIGVSESSLKRWADAGTLPTSRTAGGHRRIAVPDAVRFIRETRCGLARPELLGFQELRPAQGRPAAGVEAEARLVAAFGREDPAEARAVLLGEFLGGRSIASIVDGPLRGALASVGELWHAGADGILVEHRAVDTAVHALSTMRSSIPEPPATAPLAIGGAVPGDPYILPSLAAAVVLSEAGFRTVNLGPDLPTAALVAAAERSYPAIVWRTASAAVAPSALADDVAAIARAVAPWAGQVAIGGRTCGDLRSAGTRVHVMSSMQDLFDFARAVAGSDRSGQVGERSLA